MTAIHNVEDIFVCELRPYVTILQSNVGKAEETIRGCKFVDGISQQGIMGLGDLIQKRAICFVRFCGEQLLISRPLLDQLFDFGSMVSPAVLCTKIDNEVTPCLYTWVFTLISNPSLLDDLCFRTS